MVCACEDNKCASCKCGKVGDRCTKACHKGKDWDQVRCMNDEAGVKVKPMKMGDVRSGLVGANLSLVGDQGELRERLANALRKQGAKTTEDSHNKEDKADISSDVKPSDGKSRLDPTALFEVIASNEGDHAFILSLSGKNVNNLSGKVELRKAYLLISSMVHPDKHGSSKESVQAFQVVLSSYEYLSKPPEEEKPAAKRQKTERFTRGNDGCSKTKIVCPQCKKEWGDAVLGLEDAAYNFLMTGVKKYLCGLCFCEFGCMTALHYCPHCRKPFEYDPDDYHRKIVCGNKKCDRQFGFWMYKVAERREIEVRQEVKKKFEEDRKRILQRKRRAARADKRVISENADDQERLQENLFLIGLRDDCPRCGWQVARGDGSEETRQHLEDCTDKAVIAKHKSAVQKQMKEADAKKLIQENEGDVVALKQWELNGRQVGQLWMLSDANLQRQCQLHLLSFEGKRHEVIARLGKYLRDMSRKMLTDGRESQKNPSAAKLYDTCTIGQADEEDLPENIECLDRDELQDLCASYAVEFDEAKDQKTNLIKRFLSTRDKARGQLMICESKEEEVSDDDGDEDYVAGEL